MRHAFGMILKIQVNYTDFVGLLISTLTLLSLLYRYRWHIRLVLYEAFRGRGDRWRRLQEQHFQYDVFVSYDNEDVGWVLGNLIPRLEGDLGLEFCVHQRDFIPGQNIVDNIVHCVQNSKKSHDAFLHQLR
nr:hypothetical protein BaRGS_024140 [Batillaria attramentaria]